MESMPEEIVRKEIQTEEDIAKDCDLTIGPAKGWVWQFLGGGGAGGYFKQVIKGTVHGDKVEIVFDPSPSWENYAQAKVNDKRVSDEEALKLRDMYRHVAERQTAEKNAAKNKNKQH